MPPKNTPSRRTDAQPANVVRPGPMPNGRLLLVALVVSAAIALVTMITVDFLIPWSTAINVPELPLANWQAMPDTERDALLRSGTIKIKSIAGAEKALYVLRAAPVQIFNDWLWFMLPGFASALACGWLFTRRRGS